MKFQISVIAILILAIPSLQLNWQGTGDMNQTVMNQVSTLIANNPLTSMSSDAVRTDAAQAISTALNTLWDPAWNVVIVNQALNHDTVVYGYAFNNHWMWINGIPVSGAPSSGWGYTIWKDYNCHTWNRLETLFQSASTFTGDQLGKIANVKGTASSVIKADIWTYAHTLVNNVQAAFGSGAFTVIVTHSTYPSYIGYVCMVNKNWDVRNSIAFIDGSRWGSFFLFQTRT